MHILISLSCNLIRFENNKVLINSAPNKFFTRNAILLPLYYEFYTIFNYCNETSCCLKIFYNLTTNISFSKIFVLYTIKQLCITSQLIHCRGTFYIIALRKTHQFDNPKAQNSSNGLSDLIGLAVCTGKDISL